MIIGLISTIFAHQTVAQAIELLPYDHKQWQFDNGGILGSRDTDIDLIDAWKLCTGGTTYSGYDIVVAIIDRGVNLSHKDLASNIWVNSDEIPNNGLDDDKNGFVDDLNGWNFNTKDNDVGINGFGHPHGTAVNGIIGADGTNHIGVSGINQSVKLLNLVRSADSSSIFECYDYLINLRKKFNESQGQKGALIVAVNQSWGLDSLFAEDNPYWCQKLDEMGTVGIISVSAAPNEAINIDKYGDLPSLCTSDYQIVVTNSSYQDKKINLAGFGNESVDLCAPGHNSFTTVNNGGYGYFSGTSAAAPYIAGTIGLIYSIPSFQFEQNILAHPDQQALLVKNSILKGCDYISELGGLTKTSGRLNVYNAVVEVCTAFHDEELLTMLNFSNNRPVIYPNPTRDFSMLSIDLNQSLDNLMVRIINTAGELQYTIKIKDLPKGIQSVRIDLNEYENGTYLLSLEAKSIKQTLKIIKI